MTKKKIVFIPLAILAGVAFVGGGGLAVMLLWNAILPEIFGWKILSFWQALGLLALCRILFGGFGGYQQGRRPRSGRIAERLELLSPEERERLRNGLDKRWGQPSRSGDAQ